MHNLLFPPKPLHPEGTFVMLNVFLIRKPSRFKKLKKEQGRGKLSQRNYPHKLTRSHLERTHGLTCMDIY